MKDLIRKQCPSKVDQLIDSPAQYRPKEGWIRTLRKALGMSGPQLARCLGVSKSQGTQMERMELEDRITLKQLSEGALSDQVDREADRLMRELPRDLWED